MTLTSNVFTAERAGYVISTDATLLNLLAIHDFLCNHAYWAKGIPLATVQRALENSLCFGLYQDTQQVGLTRIITDRATYAYLCDVYVLDGHRGRGLARWLMECVTQHPDLQGLRRMFLGTRDAHSLYAQFGFVALTEPERYMAKLDPDVYLRGASGK